MEINKKKQKISSVYNGYLNDKAELKIKLFGFDKVTNINYMFDICTTIEKLEISNINTSKITNMKYLFRDCSSLISLPDISKWDT